MGLRVLAVLAGIAVVFGVLDAAVRTFVLPRAAPVRLTRLVARITTRVFRLFAHPRHAYERRDRVMALYGPLTLLTLPAVWLMLILPAFASIYVGVADVGWGTAIRWSGSALLTLGFATGETTSVVLIVFVEAAIGLTLLALLIAYLPTIYGAFSRREVAVTQLSVRAGTPPTPKELLIRAHQAGFMDQLDDIFQQWELWFVELEETHTSLVILNFFRSPNPDRSWITAAGAVLDTAAIRYAALNIPFSPAPGVCIRAGFNALRAIATYFGISYDPDPQADDPISVTREEFLALYEELGAAGLPVQSDRERAWRSYAGWRVNYDRVLVELGAVTMAPPSPWITDRTLPS